MLQILWKSLSSLKGRRISRRVSAGNDITSLSIRPEDDWPMIFRMLFDEDASIRKKASACLAKNLRDLSFKEILGLQATMGHAIASYHEWRRDWTKIDLSSLLASRLDEEEARAVLIFASLHWSRKISEEAIGFLPDYPDTLRYCLLRLKDPSQNVRVAAKDAVSRRLSRSSPKEVLSALPFAEKIAAGKRGDPESVEALFHYLLSFERQALLNDGLRSSDPITRRFCVRTLVREGAGRDDLLIRVIFEETDPVLRRMALRRLANAQYEFNEQTLERMLTDKKPFLRVFALDRLSLDAKKRFLPVIEECAMDKKPALRRVARAALQEIEPGVDFHAFYMSRLSDKMVGAIGGLGDVGTSADWDRLKSCLSDSFGPVVKASMIALVMLDADRAQSEIVRLLASDRPGVATQAWLLLMRRNVAPYRNEIAEILQKTRSIRAKRRMAQLLSRPKDWISLLYLLRLLSDEAPKMRFFVLQQIRTWLLRKGNFLVSPPETLRNEVRRLAKLHHSVLGAGLAARLDSVL